LWRSGAGGGDFGAAFAADAGARIDRHRRVHQSGQDDVRAHSELGVLDRDLLGEGDHAGLGRLVDHVGVELPRGNRRDRDDDARALHAHERQDMLAGHDSAAQVDGGDEVERGLGDLVERRVAAGNADADVVVQDIDAAPTPPRGLDHCRERRLLGDVCFECNAFAARLSRHGDRLLGGGEVVVHRQHPGALLRETHNRGAAVADALAGRLTGAHHNGDLVLQTHANLG